MDTITSYLTKDGEHCDKLFIDVVVNLRTELWDRAEACFQKFGDKLEQHFAMEESILFPEFERENSSMQVPLRMLCREHQEMRGIVALVQDALGQRAKNAFFAHAETLNMLLEQHNRKETNLLFPMADRFLAEKKTVILKAMSEIGKKN